MKRFFSLSGRLVLLATAAVVCLSAVRVAPQHVESVNAALHRDALHPATSQARIQLRKLHIVRPDLIPYPLAIEVYC